MAILGKKWHEFLFASGLFWSCLVIYLVRAQLPLFLLMRQGIVDMNRNGNFCKGT